MGFFSSKPNRSLQSEWIKQANNSVNWFGYALRCKKTNQPGDEVLDLTSYQVRSEINDALENLVYEYGLMGCSEAEIGGRRLMPLATKQTRTPVETAALMSALSINSINLDNQELFRAVSRVPSSL